MTLDKIIRLHTSRDSSYLDASMSGIFSDGIVKDMASNFFPDVNLNGLRKTMDDHLSLVLVYLANLIHDPDVSCDSKRHGFFIVSRDMIFQDSSDHDFTRVDVKLWNYYNNIMKNADDDCLASAWMDLTYLADYIKKNPKKWYPDHRPIPRGDYIGSWD